MIGESIKLVYKLNPLDSNCICYQAVLSGRVTEVIHLDSIVNAMFV